MGYTNRQRIYLLDIACLYEYEWAVDALLKAGATPDLGRLNATQTSKAIKDKLKEVVQSQQQDIDETSGSGAKRQ